MVGVVVESILAVNVNTSELNVTYERPLSTD